MFPVRRHYRDLKCIYIILVITVIDMDEPFVMYSSFWSDEFLKSRQWSRDLKVFIYLMYVFFNQLMSTPDFNL